MKMKTIPSAGWVVWTVWALSCAGSSPVQARAPSEGRAREPIALYTAAQRSASFDGCKSLFPKEKPFALKALPPLWKARGLCSDAFAVLYSGHTKTPLIVVERLNRHAVEKAQDEQRTDDFFADPRLPKKERADLKDFAKSGWDRGHLAPAADQPSTNAMAQSFALSNMVPQNPANNRKTWAKLEADTRKFVLRAPGHVYVFSGPLFRSGYRVMGRSRVWVPTHLFKLVFDESSQRSWAYVVPNNEAPYQGPPMSYAEFVKQTGWAVLGAPPKGAKVPQGNLKSLPAPRTP